MRDSLLVVIFALSLVVLVVEHYTRGFPMHPAFEVFRRGARPLALATLVFVVVRILIIALTGSR